MIHTCCLSIKKKRRKEEKVPHMFLIERRIFVVRGRGHYLLKQQDTRPTLLGCVLLVVIMIMVVLCASTGTIIWAPSKNFRLLFRFR